MGADRITQALLTAAHTEWRQEQDRKRQELSIWGAWFKDSGGSERWEAYADAVRREINERDNEKNTATATATADLMSEVQP